MEHRPTFAGPDDVAAFARVPLATRLGGRDILTMLREQTDRDGDAVAIRYLPDGINADKAITYSRRQLIASVSSIAAQFAELWLSPTGTIASLLPNGPGTIAAAMAAMAVGRLAPINIYLEPGQIRMLLKQCDAKVVLIPRDVPAAIAGTLATLPSDNDPEGPIFLTIDTVKLSEARDNNLASRTLSDIVTLFHTGGTTGLPKFVPLTAQNLAAGAIISQFAYGYTAQDSVLCAMPMFHVGGLFACSLFPLVSGSEVVILGPLGYRGEGVVAALPSTIENLDVSVVVGPPTIMAQLAANPPDRKRAKQLRLFVNGAAALPRVLGTRLSNATGAPVVEPWGLTEATLAMTSGPRDGNNVQGSVGLPLPYCEIKAVQTDERGRAIRDCGADEIGVLAVRGPMVFGGYLNRSAEQQPFFDDGWLDTGDLGRVDADGFVWVTGRAKELIKRGGHGIDPGMIEDALTAHPAVALAAAVGKPDAYAGEIPVAYIQLHPGMTASADDLLAHARAHIAERAAIPKSIILLAKLPVTAVGKVHKQTLKLDIMKRTAEECAIAIIGDDQAIEVIVEPHPLHGFEVTVRVPGQFVDAVRNKLSAFSFRANVISL
jgi:fatty-acyl-CoA synthase